MFYFVTTGKIRPQNDQLKHLRRNAPYYKRNAPHICTFWVKGECKRGEECPYRHEKPTDPDDPLSDQNIRDRFYGVNDPVANKLLKRLGEMPALSLPEDQSVTTLYLGNVGPEITEKDLHDHFYQYGELRKIKILSRQQNAFIEYNTRQAAELAAESSFNKLTIKGSKIAVRWAKPASEAVRLGLAIGNGTSTRTAWPTSFAEGDLEQCASCSGAYKWA